MPAVTINGTPFAGTVFDDESILRAPVKANVIPIPITTILEAGDGFRNKMDYGTKYRIECEWSKVPQATFDALWSQRANPNPFNYVHYTAQVFAVQIEEESDWKSDVDHTIPPNQRYYNITLIMHQE